VRTDGNISILENSKLLEWLKMLHKIADDEPAMVM
jgi:hypothetical protein